MYYAGCCSKNYNFVLWISAILVFLKKKNAVFACIHRKYKNNLFMHTQSLSNISNLKKNIFLDVTSAKTKKAIFLIFWKSQIPPKRLSRNIIKFASCRACAEKTIFFDFLSKHLLGENKFSSNFLKRCSSTWTPKMTIFYRMRRLTNTLGCAKNINESAPKRRKY